MVLHDPGNHELAEGMEIKMHFNFNRKTTLLFGMALVVSIGADASLTTSAFARIKAPVLD